MHLLIYVWTSLIPGYWETPYYTDRSTEHKC